MEGMKLIDAAKVVFKRKTSKIEIKKVSKSPIKIITDSDKHNVVENVVDNVIENAVGNTVRNDIKSINDHCNKLSQSTVCRVVRAIKLKKDIYYGPKNANKNKFMRMYKKLGLVWKTDSINNMIVDCWINSDKSQYIIKLLEEGDYKRFEFCGCDDIYDYFMDLGAVTFDHNADVVNRINNTDVVNRINNTDVVNRINNTDVVSHINNTDVVSHINNTDVVSHINNTDVINSVDVYRGADLWSSYRTRQLLKDLPDNWGVIWK